MERVVVVGSSGAGKSTFAKGLANLLGQPHIELDTLHWEEDWTMPVIEEFRARVSNAIVPEHWVVDGNYSVVRDLVWRRATAIIWLNYPLSIVLRRVFWRSVQRAWTGEILFAGNRETFRSLFFSKKSLLWWVLTTFKRRHRQFEELYSNQKYLQLQWIRFSKPKEASQFLENLKA